MHRQLTVVLAATVLIAVMLGLTHSAAQNGDQSLARGRVYHDANENRRYDPGEKLLAGIRVSNGREIVATDVRGNVRASRGGRHDAVCRQTAWLEDAAERTQSSAVLLPAQAARIAGRQIRRRRSHRTVAGVGPTFHSIRRKSRRAFRRFCSATRSRAISRRWTGSPTT